MGFYNVRNTLDKHKLNRNFDVLIKKGYTTGLFLRIGGVKIAPNRTDKIDDKYKSDIDYLVDLGVCDVVDDASYSSSYAAVPNAPIIYKTVSKSGKVSKVEEHDDFIIITSGPDIVNPIVEKPIEKLITPEIIKEVVDTLAKRGEDILNTIVDKVKDDEIEKIITKDNEIIIEKTEEVKELKKRKSKKDKK
jgi:hypothetical protein